MPEIDDEILEIKREIIESRGLTIKTNNLINSFGADIKSISKRQASYEERFNWNGAAFLVVVAVLSFVGLKIASDARISEIESEKRSLQKQADELKAELEEETRRGNDRIKAEAEAEVFYQLIQNKKRVALIKKYPELAQKSLSSVEKKLFFDINHQFKQELALEKYQHSLNLIRTARYAEAAEALQEALKLGAKSSSLSTIQYQYAVALRKLGRQQEALLYINKVLSDPLHKALHDDATYLLARCYEETGDLNGAKDAIRALMRKWPRSTLIIDARDKLRDIIRKIRDKRLKARNAK